MSAIRKDTHETKSRLSPNIEIGSTLISDFAASRSVKSVKSYKTSAVVFFDGNLNGLDILQSFHPNHMKTSQGIAAAAAAKSLQ